MILAVNTSGTIEVPSWIDSGAKITGGLDLLGLRLPVQTIGGTLLNGVTTITPSVRCLGIRAWMIFRYGQTGLPDSWTSFTEFAARLETAIVLANLHQEKSISGLIGADQALERLHGNTFSLSTSPLVQTPAATIYAGPSDQLRISGTRGAAVPGLDVMRGMPLAQLIDRSLSKIPLIVRMLSNFDINEINIDNLAELGQAARIDQIPDEERELLLSAIIPNKPFADELSRVGTYACLLTLASQLKARPSENNILDSACSMERFGEPVLDKVADGWLTYCVRDSIAVTQEAVMAAVMDEIQSHTDSASAGIEQGRVIASLMEQVEDHSMALRDLNLLSENESVTDISYKELLTRVKRLVMPNSIVSGGIRRWPSEFIETKLYKLSQKYRAGSLSLAVVAWILAELRVGDAVRESGDRDYRHLSHQGGRRLGMKEVILPELDRFEREDHSVRDVAAELAYRTVQQHLQIAWSRLQVDLNRDVAMLTAEGNKWLSRGKGYAGGRTASRLQQALGWLSQLKLIDSKGITADGSVVLERALKTLAKGA